MTKLLLAEGDFSYAATQTDHPLVACGFDSLKNVIKKYGKKTEDRLDEMKALNRVTLAFGVDATKTMHKGALPYVKNINEIEIRYPHTGVKSVASNRILLTGMITACTRLMVSPLCTDGCTLSLTLKTTGRYNEWAGDIRLLARVEHLTLLKVSRPTSPAGYNHVTTSGSDEGVQLDQSCTWTFQRTEHCQIPLEKLPEWLTKEVGEQCERCEVCNKIFSSGEDLIKHLEGKGHRKKLERMDCPEGRRKLKRQREKEVRDELAAQELVRPNRPKSKKELRMERKKMRF